jgi:hypothetical protein
MNIVDKIKSIYPQLSDNDFSPWGTIIVQDNCDGEGPFIAKWGHPSLTCPTEGQLA